MQGPHYSKEDGFGAELIVRLSDSEVLCTETEPTEEENMHVPKVPWLWAYVGFDTGQQKWFINLFNYGGSLRSYLAGHLIFIGGCASQYQWPDRSSRPFWHIRELIFASDNIDIRYEDPDTIVVESKACKKLNDEVPDCYSYLCYAFSRQTSRGFIEFFDGDGGLISCIGDRWLIVENVTRHSIGQFPNLRFRVERSEITNLVITGTAAIIVGASP